MTPTVHVTDDLAKTAGPLLTHAIASVIARKGRCRIGLSGGSTPGALYAWLARNLSVHVYSSLWVTWVDERHLPLDPREPSWFAWHPDSNYRLAQERWLASVPHLPEQVLPASRGGDLADAAQAFERGFAMYFASALDIVVLGVGPDGHIASLFPGSTALDAEGTVAAIVDSPKPPAERLSLTLPVIAQAETIVLLAAGAAKADVLARAKAGDTTLPLGRLHCEGDVHWVLDAEAAAGL